MSSPPIEVDPDLTDLAEALAASATRLTVLIRPAVLALGLSLPQGRVLAQLVDCGPRRIAELTASERVAQPSMTALVAGLVRQGWALRRPDPGDARAIRVEATDAGRAMLAAARAARARALAARLQRLGPDDRHRLTAALPALRRLADEA